jgi:hypothetical protein
MRKTILLSLASILPLAGCTADVHANVPRPPEATVTVSAPPPPQATVVVQAPPPPQATVVVQAPPPPQATVTVTAPPPPTFTVVAEPTVAVVQMRFNAADGRPAGLHAGAPEAFWVWHDGHGRNWHVRSTTAGHRHRFQGAVVSDGVITNMNATDHAFADRIHADAKEIKFDFFTQGSEDGFNFQVAGSQCVRFYMMVDGRSEPGLVHIGRTNAHPAGWHFKLCP